MNFEKIERGGHVLYMCLDSLPDPSVASAIGALALADQAARAGMRYNLGTYRRIALFVDEVSQRHQPAADRDPQQGRRRRHLHDLRDADPGRPGQRLGSEDAARMALGNLNNLIALRTKDRPTQDFVVETFGKTAIHTMRVGLSHGADAHLGDFSSSYSTQLTESFEEVVPADMLGKLPNLQYFASVSGGRIIKGRFPILDPDAGAVAASNAPEARPA
jgi:conjugal transfer pilus assembly protein TraD